MNRAVVITQNRAPQGHVFDHAFHTSNADGFTDVVLVLQQDEEAVDEVFHQSLSAKSNGESSDPSAGQQRFNVHLQDREHHQHGRKNDRESSYAIENGRNGLDLLGPES